MKKTILASLLAAAALAPMASFASDGTISFTGQVTSQTCTINGGSPNFTVALGKVSASSITASTTPAKNTTFPIALTSCNPASGSVRLFFEAGATVDPATGHLNIPVAAGNATGVQIALSTTDGTLIKAGAPTATQAQPYVAIPASGNVTLYYNAGYVGTGAPVVAGLANSSVTYSLEFM